MTTRVIGRTPDQPTQAIGADPMPDVQFGETETVRYLRPELPPLSDVARYYALSEEARFYSNGGPCYQRLASRLSAFVGDVSCVPVANCTLGLIVALREVCGLPSEERSLIAVPSFTFTATACAIRWAGFEPLFVDVDRASWQLGPDALREALARYEGSVAGVMACSTFGAAPPAPIRADWRRMCAAADVPLLIDSAAGFGALDEHGQRAGSQGETEVFSFHATKPFSIGEGGAVVTRDADLAERISQLINFGLESNTRTSTSAGLNAKLSELHCATGLAMLDRFEAALDARRATAKELQACFSEYPVTYQLGSAGSTWQGLQLLVPDAEHRRHALELADTHRIEVRTYFDPPVHRHPAFAGAPVSGELEVTEEISARTLSLPMANKLGPRQVGRLGELIAATFAR